MKKQPDRTGSLQLILVATDPKDEPIGVEAAPPHLPETLWRLPGETSSQLYARACRTAVGTGVIAARVLYPCDLPQPQATRH